MSQSGLKNLVNTRYIQPLLNPVQVAVDHPPNVCLTYVQNACFDRNRKEKGEEFCFLLIYWDICG